MEKIARLILLLRTNGMKGFKVNNTYYETV